MGFRQWQQDWQLESDLSRVQTAAQPHLIEYKSDQFLPKGHRILDQAYEKGWLPQESIDFMLKSGRLQPGAVVTDLQNRVETLDKNLDDQDKVVITNDGNDRIVKITNDQSIINPNQDQTVVIDPATNRFDFEQDYGANSETTKLLQEHPAYKDILKRHVAGEPGYKTKGDLTDRIGELDLMNSPNFVDKIRGINRANVESKVNEAKSMYYVRPKEETGWNQDASLAAMKGRYAWGNTGRELVRPLLATGLTALISRLA